MANVNALLNEAEEITNSINDTVVGDNTIEIGGKVYKVEPLPASDGLDAWEYILQKILPSVGTGLDAWQHDPVMDGSPNTFADAFSLLVAKLDGKTFKVLSQSLFTGATVDGKPLNFDTEFKANYGAWRKFLVFALKANFSSFFEEGWGDNIIGMMNLLAPQPSNTEGPHT